MSDTKTKPKPYVEMTKTERDVYWDAIAQHGGQPLPPEEKARLHEGGRSIFGTYPPDPDYLIEETADGERYLWQDGVRLRPLEAGEGEVPLPPSKTPLTPEAARRIEALRQGRANNRLEGIDFSNEVFERMCQLAREAKSDADFEQRALAELFYI